LTALIGALAGVVVLGWLSQWVEGRIGGLASLWLRGLVLPLGGTGVGMMVLGWGAWRDLPSRLELVRTPDDSRWIATHACLAGAGAFLVAIPLVWLSRVAFGGWLPEQPPPVLTDLLAAGAGRGVWVAVFVQALLLAPLAEELLFRLFLVESLRAQRIPHPALPMALVFALVHARLDQAAGLCVLALWLYRLRCRYGSLLPAILAHAVFNALALAGACWALLGNS
jgi:membrane protease YdiL (CAAX protease family)